MAATQFIDHVVDGENAGLLAQPWDEDGLDMAPLLTVISALTLGLLVVAGLGVAYTVVLNTRERRRDLAIVKAVGMTPAQATIMVVTSMAALGVLGGVLGVPGGVAAQQAIIRLIGDAGGTNLPQAIVDVYAAPQLGRPAAQRGRDRRARRAAARPMGGPAQHRVGAAHRVGARR